jgi:hypothetical protein
MLLIPLLYKTILEGPPLAPRFVRSMPRPSHRWLLRFFALERLIEPRPPSRIWLAAGGPAGSMLAASGSAYGSAATRARQREGRRDGGSSALPAPGQPPGEPLGGPGFSEQFRSTPRTVGVPSGHTRFGKRRSSRRDQGQTERDHDAPSFARSPAGGSAGHRIPPKYLYWSGSARSGGLRRPVG